MIFIIHSLNMIEEAKKIEEELKEECYIPGRDTNQKQDGDSILRDNLNAMKRCDPEVYCLWDGDSFGVLFDMGMAYALGYEIIPVKLGKDKQWKRFFLHKIDNSEPIKYDLIPNGKLYKKE